MNLSYSAPVNRTKPQNLDDLLCGKAVRKQSLTHDGGDPIWYIPR